MSQQKPPRPELVPAPSKGVSAAKAQANIRIPKPALTSAESEPAPKLAMQAFDVAIALATERLQAAQPQPLNFPTATPVASTANAVAEPRVSPARRNEAIFPVILIQQATGLTLPTQTQSAFARGAVVAVKQALAEGSSVTIVNPANARSAEGTVLWSDGSCAEIEFREAIHTFWQPELVSKAPRVVTEPQPARTDVAPTKENDVVSIAETLDFPKAVELKLVPARSVPESLSSTASMFAEQTPSRRNLRPLIIAIGTIAVLSSIGMLGLFMSRMHGAATLPPVPSYSPAKAEIVQPAPDIQVAVPATQSAMPETKPDSDATSIQRIAKNVVNPTQPALVAVNAPSKIVDTKEGLASETTSDFALRMPSPPPVISASGSSVVVATPEPVRYTEAKPVFSPQPSYPDAAKRMGAQGEVIVDVEIDANGHVTATRALSGNAVLIESAVSAARLWTFTPATRNGKPIASLKALRFHYAAR